jgi:hypothetical protein
MQGYCGCLGVGKVGGTLRGSVLKPVLINASLAHEPCTDPEQTGVEVEELSVHAGECGNCKVTTRVSVQRSGSGC